MGWKCITENCEIINGVFNNQGLAYFSISEEIKNLHVSFFEYLTNLTPGMFAMILIITMVLITLYIYQNIRDKIKHGY